MDVLSENQLDALPADAIVWMIINKSYSDFYVRIPLDVRYEPDVVGFLEKADAEQVIALLKTHDAYRNLDIRAKSELLIEVRRGARIYEQPIYFFDRARALELFVVLAKNLENYEG